MEREPKGPSPQYPPEEVARAILRCAEKPMRDVVVGGVPRVQGMLATMAPRLTDLFMERRMWDAVKTERPPQTGDSLHAPSGEDYGRRRGRYPGYVMRTSAYTRAAMSDVMRAAPLVALGAAIAAVAVARR